MACSRAQLARRILVSAAAWRVLVLTLCAWWVLVLFLRFGGRPLLGETQVKIRTATKVFRIFRFTRACVHCAREYSQLHVEPPRLVWINCTDRCAQSPRAPTVFDGVMVFRCGRPVHTYGSLLKLGLSSHRRDLSNSFSMKNGLSNYRLELSS